MLSQKGFFLYHLRVVEQFLVLRQHVEIYVGSQVVQAWRGGRGRRGGNGGQSLV